MKAEEVMIGDWLYMPEEPNSDKMFPVKVTLVNECGYVELFDGSGDYPLVLNEDGIKPIPLTDKIFEKNGFKLNEKYTPIFTIHIYYSDVDGIALIQRPNGGWKFMQGDGDGSELFFGEKQLICTPVEYVHELQHLLKICKINKEIKL